MRRVKMKKKTKKGCHPRVKGGNTQSFIVATQENNITKELEKSIPIGVLPLIFGRLPIFLPLQKAKKVDEKSVLRFDNDNLSFIGSSKRIKEVYIDGYILTTQEEDMILFFARKAVIQGRLIKTSYAEISRMVFGKKKLNTEVRKRIEEILNVLAKAEITIVENDWTETTFGFISDRRRKQDEDYRHPLFVYLKDVFFSMITKNNSFYIQNLKHRRKLRSPNLKKIYSFLCSTNFKQVSLRKIYDNCRIKQRWCDFKRTMQNPKLIQFLGEVKNCEVQINVKKELVVFIPKIKAIRCGKNE